MRKHITFLVAVFLALQALSFVAVRAGSLEPILLAGGSNRKLSPCISEHFICWFERKPEDTKNTNLTSTLMCYDIEKKETFQFADNIYNEVEGFGDLSISGNYCCFENYNADKKKMDNDIIGCDLINRKQYKLTRWAGLRRPIAIWNNYVFWKEDFPKPRGFYMGDINKPDDDPVMIYKTTYSYFKVADNGFLVWADIGPYVVGRPDSERPKSIKIFEISTGKVTTIDDTPGGYFGYPVISGDYVYYTYRQSGDEFYTLKGYQLTSKCRFDVWKNSPGLNLYSNRGPELLLMSATTLSGKQDLFCYDEAHDKIIKINKESDNYHLFMANDSDRVIWTEQIVIPNDLESVDHKARMQLYNQLGWSLKLYDCSENRTITLADNFSLGNGDFSSVGICKNVIVFTKYNADNEDLYIFDLPEGDLSSFSTPENEEKIAISGKVKDINCETGVAHVEDLKGSEWIVTNIQAEDCKRYKTEDGIYVIGLPQTNLGEFKAIKAYVIFPFTLPEKLSHEVSFCGKIIKKDLVNIRIFVETESGEKWIALIEPWQNMFWEVNFQIGQWYKFTGYLRDPDGEYKVLKVNSSTLVKNCEEPKEEIKDIEITFKAGSFGVIWDTKTYRYFPVPYIDGNEFMVGSGSTRLLGFHQFARIYPENPRVVQIKLSPYKESSKTFIFTVDDKEVQVNDETISADVPMTIKEQKLLFPLVFICKQLGLSYNLDKESGIMKVTLPNQVVPVKP